MARSARSTPNPAPDPRRDVTPAAPPSPRDRERDRGRIDRSSRSASPIVQQIPKSPISPSKPTSVPQSNLKPPAPSSAKPVPPPAPPIALPAARPSNSKPSAPSSPILRSAPPANDHVSSPPPAPASDESDEAIIDWETFNQILEMDEEDDHEFSISIMQNYFEQAVAKFEEMDTALVEKDLASLSSLGHFLKGSSAALGIQKVQHSCERMQHYGKLRDEDAGVDLSPAEALKKITALLEVVKVQHYAAEKWLKDYFKTKFGEDV